MLANSFSPVEPTAIVFEVFDKTVPIYGNSILVFSYKVKSDNGRIIKWIKTADFKDFVLRRRIFLVSDLCLKYHFAIL